MAENQQIKVIFVENDPNVRLRLQRAISGLADIHEIGSAATYREADALVSQFKFQMLIVDLDLPDGFGLDLIRRTAANMPEVDIMVLANANDDPHVVSAIESGATGYVLKTEIENSLVSAIRLLAAGGSPVSPEVAKSVLRALRTYTTHTIEKTTAPIQPNPLSERETEILQLLAKGMSFNEIGDILTISPHTVTAHIKKIYRKLQVHSRGEAVYEAAQMGLIS
ncbi:response regulator transcription factor [Parasutterella secunda]|jgi:DNA-binding NarL/FixJ family response regulator|uniref:response regulator transcription factor n=1 Tax=Parasutterella secunda TaxID=626947 RepID=UPI00033CB28F|nr:response regulator transcription factor [Parasutterella secunda]CDE76356.1 transcriptional regulator LuxR family [Sutterella sp. CAG:521]HJI94697.1 response regulator transcription factor [Sutterellaceae bacterium]MCL1597155.1 response regulator transcription factor [Parasutterella secunda]MCR8920028.1 response regulator transcription factor [Parasutterella secunda]MDM8218011.1 response regulator transcription factor [Parasutterella secunda]